jgi:zinc protease
MKTLSRIFIFLFITVQSIMAGIFNAQTHTLPNGLQIIVIPNTLSPSVSVGLLYKVGTADDPSHMIGLSHFLEHMMFKGTKAVPGDQYNKIISRIGGFSNAMTNFDYTLYVAEVAAPYLEMIIQMEADRMVNLSFDEKEVEPERHVVWEERRMRLENHPFGQAYELLFRALNPYHPYGTLPIGYPQHIQAYTYEALRSHYTTWYRPNNAILIVVGHTTLEDVKQLAQKHFGPIPTRDVPTRQRVQNPPRGGITQHIEQKNPRNSAILLNWFYDAPTFKQNKKLCFSLTVLAHILGGHQTSSFYRHFVEDTKLCLSVSANYDDSNLDSQPFSLNATLAPTMDVHAFKKELTTWIQTIKNNGIPEDEIAKAKRDLLAELAFLRDGNMKVVETFTGLATGMALEDYENYGTNINDVTAADITQAIEHVFSAPPSVTMDLYPQTTST